METIYVGGINRIQQTITTKDAIEVGAPHCDRRKISQQSGALTFEDRSSMIIYRRSFHMPLYGDLASKKISNADPLNIRRL